MQKYVSDDNLCSFRLNRSKSSLTVIHLKSYQATYIHRLLSSIKENKSDCLTIVPLISVLSKIKDRLDKHHQTIEGSSEVYTRIHVVIYGLVGIWPPQKSSVEELD